MLSLTELASQTQTHVAELSAKTSRLSDTLTQLTDDIVRSGSRLAYEVEVLRGEAYSLSEALTDGLHEDIEKIGPRGSITNTEAGEDSSPKQSSLLSAPGDGALVGNATGATDPSAISSLRTLHHVRENLQSVIAIFDAALHWPLPPSSLSISSSLISVSAPQENQSLEEKGQEAAKKFKDEISTLLAKGGTEGVLAAEKRIEELRELVGVWKGTAEEKARGKFVEALAKAVAERRKGEESRGGLVGKSAPARSRRASDEVETNGQISNAGGGPAFLKRLREEIYIE